MRNFELFARLVVLELLRRFSSPEPEANSPNTFQSSALFNLSAVLVGNYVPSFTNSSVRVFRDVCGANFVKN